MKDVTKVLIFLGVVMGVYLIYQHIEQLPALLQNVFEWVGDQGTMAPIFYVGVFTLGTFLLLSIFLMSIAGGFLFGLLPGAGIIVISMTLSSVLAYFIGHTWSPQWVRAQVEKSRMLRAMDRVIKKAGWQMVVLTRIAPLFPFTPLNFTFGLSGVKFWHFLAASFFGFLPGAFLNAYVGSMAGSLLGLHERAPVAGEKIFLGLSITVAILATVYMSHLTRQVLREKEDDTRIQ